MHGIKLSQSDVVVLVLQMAEHTVVPERAVVGSDGEGTVVVGDGLRKLLLLDTRQATQLIDADNVGIALDGLRAVGLGTRKIVEVVFGHTTKEPRLVEVGLGCNGLIKILHAKDIVLVVERRAANCNQPFNVVLGATNKGKQE